MQLKIKDLPSPVLLFILILFSIFFADIVTTMFLATIQRPRLGEVELIDSFLLALISFPMVYFFMYRPLVGQITKRRAAEEKAINLYAAIEQTDEAVIISTAQGNIQYANPAFERITGYVLNETAGKDILLLKSGQNDDATVTAIRQSIRDGAGWKGDLVLKRSDGQFFDAFVSITPVRGGDGGLSGYISVVSDITNRKRTEVELRLAKKQAEDAVKLKEKFVTLVVHDLKSPFNSIVGYLQILKRDKECPVHEKHKELIERMILSSGTMVRMIDEILSLSRIQLGSIRPKRRYFNVYSLVNALADEFHFMLVQKGLILENLVPPDTEAFADYHLIKEVMQNLVSNDIKFTDKGGRITVSLPPGVHNIISVRDTGVGISGQIIPQLFRMEEKTSTYGTAGERGSGFGLPLSYEIVKAHGGELSVESEEGQGSAFYIKLPEIKPVALLFGADADTKEAFRKLLPSLKMKLVEIEEREDAVSIIKHDPPNLVVIDYTAVTSEKPFLLDHIKGHLESREIPVIVITTEDESTEVKNALFNSQVDDYVTKPISENKLFPRINRFIRLALS